MKDSAKYVLGPKKFISKKQIRDYCQGLLAKPQRLTGDDRLAIAALLRWHPDAKAKYGCGLRHIDVMDHPAIPGRCFHVTRTDGSVERFSYRRCLEKQSVNTLIKEAFRAAVISQVLSIKNEMIKAQARCDGMVWLDAENTWAEVTDVVLDHYPVPFVAILDAFLLEKNIELPSVEVMKDIVTDRVSLVDESLSTEWKMYHLSKATYRLASQVFNSQSGSHGYKRTELSSH